MDPPIVLDEPSSVTLCHNANIEDESLNPVAPGENSLDDLARGISSLLTTAFTDFDSKASDAVKSQDNLLFAINRLTRELDQLLEDAPVPFIMQHAAKISAVRKRVSSLNSLLKAIQRRLDNIDRTLSSMSSSQDWKRQLSWNKLKQKKCFLNQIRKPSRPLEDQGGCTSVDRSWKFPNSDLETCLSRRSTSLPEDIPEDQFWQIDRRTKLKARTEVLLLRIREKALILTENHSGGY
ncbi:unnamed protein product [Rhodiola kirilowii]